MKLEVGKPYRMRCGGAVRIDGELSGIFHVDNRGWLPDGRYWLSDNYTVFDLVAEISEADYNRIISGSSSEIPDELEEERRKWNSLLDTAEAQIEVLINTARVWENVANELGAKLDVATAEIDRLKNDRRERISTAAMLGLIAGDVNRDWEFEAITEFAVKHAYSLIKALDAKEEQK